MPKHKDISLAALPGDTATEKANYKRLLHVGFTHRQVQFLVSARDAAALKTYRGDFNRVQRAELISGAASTMATLLRAKFTRNQAKVLLELGLV